MPFYEYKCMECGAITEVLRPIKSRDRITACGKCGAVTERVMSRFNAIGSFTMKSSRGPFNTDSTCAPRGTAVRMEGGSATFKDCSFQNFQTGISVAKGSTLSIDGSKFENVGKPVEITNE